MLYFVPISDDPQLNTEELARYRLVPYHPDYRLLHAPPRVRRTPGAPAKPTGGQRHVKD
ncbi:hypothetical protein [Motiliproteus coralliicola]|uniref:hypothetical protein n=1 Tax=Motiliproteus coralliicola TaxID=2283196 RepID=UPI00140276CD|nr:hypothetical protein [Motiliproteus coralliicola]